MAAAPFVSCIMPTRNRRRFVAQAISYFQRQDYARCELIVVDDGEDPVDDLVPVGDRIRYVRLDGHWQLGRKRNLACELGRGDVICHWDDDDWYAPDRVRRQVGELLDSGADVCGLNEVLHYRPRAGEAWLYRSLPGDRPWLAGGTLVYRRAAWRAGPFPDVHVGEDTGFVWRMDPARVHAIAGRGLYVALLHGRNTAAKNLSDGRWSRQPLNDVSRLLTADRDFYAALRRHEGAMPDPRASTAISVVAPFQIYDGYGSMSEYLVRGMHRAGARIDPIALGLDRDGLSEEFLSLLDRSRPQRGAPVLYYSWPSPSMRPYETAPDLFVNTMWESSRLPAGWSGALNRARAVIVPTRFVADVCRRSGVTAPIEVVPEGVDPAVYRYEPPPERETFTTLIVGPVVERKHAREGIAAWERAFAGDPLARLIVKARFNYRNYRPEDPRIRLVDSDEKTRGIARWYRVADVLLALGNEGFGLPLIEGMATGLPVIALDSEGQSDTCEEARDLLLPVAAAGWQRCDDPPYGPAGVRGVPAVRDVAERLRWVAEHREEAREMGRAASSWALQRRDVWDKGPAVLATIERGLRVPRVLRTARTLWTPLWGRPCGVAEYTRDLGRALRTVATTAAVSDLRGVRLLHLQHEPSLIGDGELARMARQARAEAVPMVVTQHAVTARAAGWEREVAALVTTTAAGARELRSRWPDQRVEHIPHGCHTWFPPRKHARGRVIGAFGFRESYKGFDRLIEAAAELDGAEVVLYSYDKRAGAAGARGIRARGLPVRWETEFLATEAIARRLAAEVDVLAYWYEDTSILAASGAARVGLATGIPVLTSPTRWFEDLRHATYQPDDLVAGLARLLEDADLRRDLSAAAREHCHEHSWERIARRHEALWQSLEHARPRLSLDPG
jgi:glycosyltransferase involved in cell wall biosynthesis